MLVLKRKVRQKLILRTSDGVIEITVTGLSSSGGERQYNIGCNAPKNVEIYREEVAPDELRGCYSAG